MSSAPSDPLAALLADVATCDSAFKLMERLLRFCRDEAAAFRAWDSDPTNQLTASAANTDAKRLVADDIGTVFTPEDDPATLTGIHTAVAAYLGQSNPPGVVRAKLLLDALDFHLTPNLRPLYPAFHPGPLAPGALFPVYWPDLKHNGWFPPNKLSPQPASLAPPPDFLSKWALAPSANVFSGRRVEFAFPSRTDVSPPMAGALKIGVGVLNVKDDLTWDTDPGPPALFRDVRPRDRTQQVDAMRRLVTAAATEGVRVLVFPELCIDRAGAAEVFRHVESLPTPPALVVIGSHHWSDGTVRRNTSTAFRAGTPQPLEHHKMAPFSYREAGTTYREDIRPEDTVRVFVATDWSLVLLICRDFLDLALGPLVEALRPTFLCVPSFSQTVPFVDLAGAVTAKSQTVVVFANGPVPKDRVVAAFCTPRLPEQTTSGASLARQHIAPEPLPTLPYLVIYDGQSDAIRCLPC